MAASQCLEQFSPQQLSNTLWALAQLQHSPPKHWTQQLLLVSLQQMSAFKPADYAQTLSGLARLGFSPSPLWLNSFWSKSGQCLTGSAAAAEFTAAELHALLLAVVTLDVQPPQKWVQAAAAAVERGLAGFGSQQLLEVLQTLQQLWQASSGGSVDAPAAAVADGVAAEGANSSGMAVRWSSSLVPISSQPARGALQLQSHAGDASSSSSRHHSRKVLAARYPHNPGVVRLYRQLCASQRVVPAGRGLVRPVWPPLVHSSNQLHAHAGKPILLLQQQQGSESQVGVGAVIQQQQQLGFASSSYADEAYSLACLVLLMPPDMRSWLEHWPQRLAGQRAARVGQ